MAPAPWSSHGDWVAFSTPSEAVLSMYADLSYVPGGVPETDPYALWSGTSFGAPQIAGAVARAGYELGMKPPEAVSALLAAGIDVAGYGKALRVLP